MIRTVWLVLLIVAGSQCSETAQKRILLSDPQYIQQELTRFQSELQELQVKLNAQERENADLKSTVAQLQTTVQTNKGAAVFTRWGRKDCSGNTTSLVYTGYAGGSMYTDTGAAAEYLCMPSDPIWGPHKDLVYNSDLWVGYVYGAEYEDTGDGLFGFADNVHDVPCAVCLASQYTTSLMIPGRTECYPGWTEAYHGDMASGAHNAGSSHPVRMCRPTPTVPGGRSRQRRGQKTLLRRQIKVWTTSLSAIRGR
ncbi:uncharacterized protein LOC117341630 [Pecten maximus]|uniref:uncharacterized protein LOC117341630 n=1 Tax=Pecten maximus TaxID=6579 RepID=UPI0014591A0E|nr:uncharacterized protein LOC117341630 [Pecten maximus]